MPERFKVVCTMQGAIQVLSFTFYLYLYDCIQLKAGVPCLNMLYNIELQYFRAKLSYKLDVCECSSSRSMRLVKL